MILSEEEVYNGCKSFLLKNSFNLISGDPPRGIDPSLPFIEIKGENDGLKGSKNSYKPDLIAYKENIFYVIECKPKYDYNDYLKLIEIKNNKNRKLELYKALVEKKIFSKLNLSLTFEVFSNSIDCYLCYSTSSNKIENINDEFNHIIITSFLGEGIFV